MFYFAYGSNLSQEQMRQRCHDSRLVGRGCLEGYRLDFTHYSTKRGGGTADVVECQNEEVWGLVYEISAKDRNYLDSKEARADIYTRFQTNINTDKSRISDVWVYKVVQKESFVPPTREYLQIIKDAAAKFDFPEKYRKYLDTIRTG